MSVLGKPPGRRILTLGIRSPAGELEALFRPASRALGGALVCHPHPLFGGTMHNRVVVAAERGFVTAGLSTLRFNFRGVGRSEGGHDGGRGERDDVRAALRVLAARVPGLPLVVAGYSFGCSVGLSVGAADERVAGLMGMGVPFVSNGPPRLEGFRRPVVLVQGDRDRFGPVEELRRWAAGLEARPELILVPGADHFFAGELVLPVREAAAALGTRVVEEAAGGGENL